MDGDHLNKSHSPRFEFTGCLLCDSDTSHPVMSAPNRFNPQEKFNLVQCANCGFMFLNPRPDAVSIAAYYEDEKYQPHQAEAISLTEKAYGVSRVWNNRYKRRLIDKRVGGGKILDYGCGTGEFLLEMGKTGWETFGFEPSARAADTARKYGITLVDGISQLPGKMDVITLWHVLEHVHQARTLLADLRTCLAPSGYLIIAVPNRNSYDAKIFREHWVAYDAPRHLYHFTPADMQALLNSCRFQLASLHRLYLDPWYNSLLSAQLEARCRPETGVTGRIIRLAWSAMFSSLQSLVNKKLSSSIIYVAKPHNPL